MDPFADEGYCEDEAAVQNVSRIPITMDHEITVEHDSDNDGEFDDDFDASDDINVDVFDDEDTVDDEENLCDDDEPLLGAERGDGAITRPRREASRLKRVTYGLDPPPHWLRTLARRWARDLYGDIEPELLVKVGALSAILAVIIGGFWLLDSLKDAILITIVGIEYIPALEHLESVDRA